MVSYVMAAPVAPESGSVTSVVRSQTGSLWDLSRIVIVALAVVGATLVLGRAALKLKFNMR